MSHINSTAMATQKTFWNGKKPTIQTKCQLKKQAFQETNSQRNKKPTSQNQT